MDIPRKSAARKRQIRRVAFGIVGLGVIVAISVGVSRLKPAAPSVEFGTLWPDTVKRGPMIRQVRGLGTLVPEEIRWVPAITEGVVERILVQVGTEVKPDTVLVVLSNPEIERDVVDAEAQLKAEEASYERQRVQLQSDLLRQQADAARVQSEYHQAKLRADTEEGLAKQGLIAELTFKLSQVAEQELANRNNIEQKRLKQAEETIKATLAVQQALVDQRKALYHLRKSQLDSLQVRAGIEGVLQQLPLDLVGQRVSPGTNLARVSQPGKLKAELRIAETQARDIARGLSASIDTRNGIIPGHVIRVDPASQNGTVTVDVALDGELPKGARPDLNVEGTIELQRLDDVLYIGRPVHGQEGSTIGLFKVDPDRKGASRVQVRLGVASVSTIEVLEGLQVGDQVILSDMSAWDAYDRIRFD
jgi:HlyD family secretion protein